MERVISIQERAEVLLTPKDTLNLQLFDFGEQILDDVRQILLYNADYIIRSTITTIPGLEIKDIFLDGSMAGYFYHDHSDINVRIGIYNKNNPDLTTDTDILDNFLDNLFLGSLQNFKFNIHNRPVHIKFKAIDFEPMGLYSILNNKWIIPPNWNFVKGLSLDEIMAEYRLRKMEITNHLEKIKKDGSLTSKDGIDRLIKYFMNLTKRGSSSAKDNLVYKLLNYHGIFSQIRLAISASQKEFLSLSSD